MVALLFDPVVHMVWEGVAEAGWREPPRRLYDHELVYVSEGEMTLTLEGRSQTVAAGGVALIPPDCLHESRVERGRTAMRHCLHFAWVPDQRAASGPFWRYGDAPLADKRPARAPVEVRGRLPLVATPERVGPVRDVLDGLFARIRRGDAVGERLLWVVLRHLVVDGAGQNAAGRRGSKTDRAVATVKLLIENRYAEAIGYPEFVRAVRLSRSHLCQAFSARMGCPPTAYLNEVRLQEARRLLEEGTLNVAEVARRVGIPNANYFGRIFRKRFGCPPSRLSTLDGER